MSLTEYLPHQGLTYNIHVDYIFADINFEDSNAERPKKQHTPADAFLCAHGGRHLSSSVLFHEAEHCKRPEHFMYRRIAGTAQSSEQIVILFRHTTAGSPQMH